MKKMQDFSPPATDDGEEDKGAKEQLIEALIAQGHVPILVDRGIIVIEQCEDGDTFPKGWSQDPLKISIYSDPGVSGRDVPSELFIHAGRYGFMEAFLSPEPKHKLFRLMPVDASAVEHLNTFGSNIAEVETILSLIINDLTGLSGRYSEYRDNGVGFKEDETLAQLGKEAQEAVKRYLEHLRSLPNVWSGYWDEKG
jgi:hypothetical protein